METNQIAITFKGPSLASVAGQALAFASSLSQKGATTTAAQPKTAKAAKTAPVEETTDLTSIGEAEDDTESLLGANDETGETLGIDEDGGSFDAIADEPANKSSTPAKNAAAKKAPKVTVKEVNAALVNYMKVAKKSKEQTQALLKKHFKVESVSELKEVDYAKVIAAVTPKK